MPFAGLEFAVIFFLALVIAGISSSISIIEAIIAAVMDKFEVSRKKSISVIAILGFLGSLLYTTKAGVYWLDMVDHFTSGYLLPIVGTAEALVAMWLFKGDKLLNYLNNLSDIKIGTYWKFFVGIVAPVLLVGIICLDIVSLIRTPYGGYSWKYLTIASLTSLFGILTSFVLSKLPWKRKVHSWDEFVKKK